MKKFLLFVPVLIILPLVIIFDTLLYFITRPACLNCGNLVEFLKNASLSVALIGSVVGYKLKREK